MVGPLLPGRGQFRQPLRSRKIYSKLKFMNQALWLLK